MKELLKRIWKDPVWSTVISGGILAAITFLPIIGSSKYTKMLKSILCYDFPLYVYLIFSIFIITCYCLFRVCNKRAYRLYKKSDFNEDVILTWEYDKDGNIEKIAPICKKCNRLMTANLNAITIILGATSEIYKCPKCGEKCATLDEDSVTDFIDDYIYQKTGKISQQRIINKTK